MPVYGWVAFGILITGLLLLVFGGNGDTLLGADPQQIGALTAMMALLVYLGGGMLGRDQPIAPLLRHLLVWGGVFAVLLVGYWAYQNFFA